MTDLPDLVAWLRAQLDEDERAARAATPGPWHVGTVMSDIHTADVYNEYTSITSAYEEPCCAEEDAAHIARHDPARVLAEVAAKRAILDRYVLADAAREGRSRSAGLREDFSLHARASTLYVVLLDIASVYAGRPGWREEWVT